MLGIVILNYNAFEDTIKCVESIVNTCSIRYKIYIVDNASTNDSVIHILSYKNKHNYNIELIQCQHNKGYSKGNNEGIKSAIKDNIEYLLISNPDVIFLENSINCLASKLKENSKTIITAPYILGPNREYMQFALKKYTFKSFLFSKKPFFYLKRKKYRFHNYNNNTDYEFTGMTSGCCFMIKAKLFDKLGMFDEEIFLFYEEDILCYKLDNFNYKTCIVSNARIIHNHSSSVKKESKAFNRYHRFISAKYVLTKYAKINLLEIIYVIIVQDLLFIMLSLVNSNYRKILKAYLQKSFNLNK